MTAKLDQAISAAANGFAVEPGTPEALAAHNKVETAKREQAIREAKIQAQ